jgi:heme oxygenase
MRAHTKNRRCSNRSIPQIAVGNAEGFGVLFQVDLRSAHSIWGPGLAIKTIPEGVRFSRIARRFTARSALGYMREATHDLHQQLEERLDVIAQLSDPSRRATLIERYAALYLPSDDALMPWLKEIADLDHGSRSRTPLLARFAGEQVLPPFPVPLNEAEALGMLYVLEGSTLGGRFILRALAERGIEDPDLTFLDPYGAETGARWRAFLAVLARETEGDAARINYACLGAVRAFQHAECVLCRDAA